MTNHSKQQAIIDRLLEPEKLEDILLIETDSGEMIPLGQWRKTNEAKAYNKAAWAEIKAMPLYTTGRLSDDRT